MQEESGRVEVKDFAFRSAHRLRLFPSPESTGGNIFDGLTSYRLLTVSNAYGLIFVAWPGQALKVIPTSEIHRLLDDTSRDRDSEVVNYKSASIELGGGASSPIVRLHCNCDGTALAICYDHPTPIAHIYDVRALSPDYPGPKPIAPFCRIRLDDVESSTLTDFQWNPTTLDVFSSCCSSGTVTVVSVNMNQINTFTVQGAIKRTPEAAATCLSWSPKGKQLSIGFDNGLVCQYKPQNLQLAKKWSPPSQAVALLLHRLVDICWLSTNQFALVSTGGRPEGDQLVLVHMTLPKESGAAGGGHPVYMNYDDVCYGSAGERRSIPTRYLMQHVQEWAMLLCSSTASTETAVLAWKADIKKWQVWDLEENGRCQLPLTAIRSDETYPIGIDVDRTAEAPVQLKRPDGEIERIIPPAPVMLILSTDGAICPFRMVFKGSDTALCQPARKIDNLADVKVGTVSASQFVSPAPAAASTPSSFNFATSQPKPGAAPTGSIGSTTSGGDITATFTLPLPPKKQPITGVGQLPAFPQPPAAAQNQQLVSTAPPPAVHLEQQRPPEPKQETAEERAEKEKNRLLRLDFLKKSVDFEKQLSVLKSKLAQPLGLPGNRDRLAEGIQKLQEIERQIEDVGNVTETEKTQVDNFRVYVCGQAIRADQTKLLAERFHSKEFRSLIRYRPLSIKQEKEMEARRRQLKEAHETVENLSTRLDRLDVFKKPWQQQTWSNSPALTKGQKKNSLDLIYQTISNMQAIVTQQRQRVDAIKRAEAMIPKKKEGGRRRKTYGLDETDQLVDSFTDTHIADDSNDNLLDDIMKKPSDSALTKSPQTTNDSLTRLLEKRVSTPRKAIKPATAAAPKLVSTAAAAPKLVSTAAAAPTSVPAMAIARNLVPDLASAPTTAAAPKLIPSTAITPTLVPTTRIGPNVVPTTAIAPNLVQVMASASNLVPTTASVPDVKPAVPAKSAIAPNLVPAMAAAPNLVRTAPIAKTAVPTTASAPTLVKTTSIAPNMVPTTPAAPKLVPAMASAPTSVPSTAIAPTLVKTTSIAPNLVPGMPTLVPAMSAAPTLAQAMPTLVPAVASPPNLVPTTAAAPTLVPTTPAAPNLAPEMPTLVPAMSAAPTSAIAPTLVPSTASPPTLVPAMAAAPNLAPAATPTTASVPDVKPAAPAKSAMDMDMEAEIVPSSPPAPVQAPSTSPAAGFSFLTGTAATSSPASTTAASPPAAPSGSGIFGGGGGFFSGLGGQPDPEAAKKNVFGFGLQSPLTAKTGNDPQIKSLFGGPGASPKVEAAPSPGFGSFGGSPNPGVGQQGFGSFGSPSPSGSTGVFGGSPAFGGKSSFGGGSVFGGSSAFGGPAPTGGSVFGGSPSFGQMATSPTGGSGFGSSFGGGSGFAAFAQKPMPTFGALAGVTESPPQPPQPSSPFGGSGGGFGGGVFGGESTFSGFGALAQQPQPTFGGQVQSTQQQSSSFSHWR